MGERDRRARADTSADKSRIVEEGNYHKFTKCKDKPEMRKLLLATGDRELVEVSCFPPMPQLAPSLWRC